jgi:hypothetical protein
VSRARGGVGTGAVARLSTPPDGGPSPSLGLSVSMSGSGEEAARRAELERQLVRRFALGLRRRCIPYGMVSHPVYASQPQTTRHPIRLNQNVYGAGSCVARNRPKPPACLCVGCRVAR